MSDGEWFGKFRIPWSPEFRFATRRATERAVTEISGCPWPISLLLARFTFASRVERYREQELRRLQDPNQQ
jgi:hypothetical protein